MRRDIEGVLHWDAKNRLATQGPPSHTGGINVATAFFVGGNTDVWRSGFSMKRIAGWYHRKSGTKWKRYGWDSLFEKRGSRWAWLQGMNQGLRTWFFVMDIMGLLGVYPVTLLFNDHLLTDVTAEWKKAPHKCQPRTLAQKTNQHIRTPWLLPPSQKEGGKRDKAWMMPMRLLSHPMTRPAVNVPVAVIAIHGGRWPIHQIGCRRGSSWERNRLIPTKGERPVSISFRRILIWTYSRRARKTCPFEGCNEEFNYNDAIEHFKGHIQEIEPGDRKCPLASCSLKWHEITPLAEHIYNDHGFQRFPCPAAGCVITFAKPYGLGKHRREACCVCIYCGRESICMENRKKHERRCGRKSRSRMRT